MKGKARDLRDLQRTRRRHERRAAEVLGGRSVPGPEAAVAAQDRSAWLRARILASLDAPVAGVAVLHLLEGMSLKACGSVLGRSHSWVKARWREARPILGKLLEEESGRFRKKP